MTHSAGMYALVALGGGVGAMLRFAVGLTMNTLMFPWATLAVNIAGAALIGLLWGVAEDAQWFADWGRALLVVGLLGGFTTFSAFSLETMSLLDSGRWSIALAYVLTSVFGCIIATWLAYRAASLGA
ncbi:MAG: fluoride efflux transporter CrcB [Pseudomonadaceae bacterium]|nr:fluoride efflux transporter CrcB [Pseudomonadaceae bacterium]